jgi:hypothetical protein
MNLTMTLSLFSTLANGTMPASLLPKEQESIAGDTALALFRENK